MKIKTVNRIFTIMFILFNLLFSLVIFNDTVKAGETIIVDIQGNGDYTVIQDAIDNAEDGDTIIVWAGTYQESIIVNKSINLIGNGTGTTFLIYDSTNLNAYIEAVVNVRANHTNISGFFIDGWIEYEGGIYISCFGIESPDILINNVTVSDCEIINCLTNGVNVGFAENISLSNLIVHACSLEGGDNGIRLGEVSYTTIDNCTVYDIDDTDGNGIGVSDSSYITITDCDISTCQYGMRIESNNNITVNNCRIEDNLHTGTSLVELTDSLVYNNYYNDNVDNVDAYDNVNLLFNITKTLGTNIINGMYLGGNYWNDYYGDDTDDDGLGDTLLPYDLGIETGGDYHPLVSSYGILNTSVYNESNCSESLIFDILVSNKQGTQNYLRKDCTNGILIPLDLLPSGNDTIILISSEGYNFRVYYMDIDNTTDYKLTAYLPPKVTQGEQPNYQLRPVTDSKSISNYLNDLIIPLSFELAEIIDVQFYNKTLGWVNVPIDKYTLTSTQVTIDNSVFDENSTQGKISYYYTYYPNVINSYLYQLTVKNRYEQPLDNAKVYVKRYINCTDAYENMSILLTDAVGHCDVYLIPNCLYQFYITKTDFVAGLSYWVTTNLIQTHDFILEYFINETIPNINPYDYINLTATFTDNITLNIQITDSSGVFYAGILYVYENNTLIYQENLTSGDIPYNEDYTYNSSRPQHNKSDYTVRLEVYNHSVIGAYDFSRTIPKVYSSNLLLDLDNGLNFFLGNFGSGWGANVGWINLIILCIGTFIIVSFGRYFAGIGTISLGLVIGLLEYKFGLPGFTGIQIICFIAFCIIIGALSTIAINKQGRIN